MKIFLLILLGPQKALSEDENICRPNITVVALVVIYFLWTRIKKALAASLRKIIVISIFAETNYGVQSDKEKL